MDPAMASPGYRSVQSDRSNHLTELETRIQNLADNSQRDDVKLKMLQEIWSTIENHFTLSSHEKVVERLILSFLQVFCNTSPQFIAENNTQQLRKLMLEIILRLSNVEAMKHHSKEIIKQMMRLITVENEENANLAIKIVTDQGRSTGKMQYCGEVSQIMVSFKTMVIDLTASGRAGDMFNIKEHKAPPSTSSDEQVITEYLKTCYYQQTVLLNGTEGKPPLKYNMIPSAHQSTKVLLEVPYLVIFFYQHFKTAIQTEALDFMRLGLDFLNVRVPDEDKLKTNQIITDDFVSAQSRFLSFVNIMAKIPAFMDLIMQNGPLLVSGTMQMLERCPADLISVRREVLMALKYFTSGEMKSKFFPMLPRLIAEEVVLGTGFTAIEHLRVFMYQMLADLLHHMRNSIDYEMITHVIFVFCRTLHDPNNSSQVQIMSARLLNSLAESLCKMDSHDTFQTRDLLIEILESHVAKLKTLAVYHMPILFQQYGTEIDYEYKSYERDAEKPGMNIPKDTIRGVPKRRIRRLSIDSVEELEFLASEPSTSEDADESGGDPNKLPPPTKEGKKTSPEAILTAMSTMTPPPLAIVEARNLVKYIMHTCKFVTGQLRIARPSQDMYHCSKERDLFERLLRYGVMCMDVFVLPTTRNQPQMHSSMRTKDEKDALESLANVFTTIDHAIFREIFEKYMDFLIERIYNRNYPLQLMVNTFLVRNEVPFFASTMLSFLMSRMKLLEVSNDKTMLYVKLFKIIFSAIGANGSGLHGDKMLTSYLPEILKQSTVLALTAREPLNYFLLLRALFRSIGGGAQDILYGKFLQLLPNLLQFLNKLTNLQSCQHRIQMRELFVELCLTVPVRLSSLLPYLPLLMDPLVCAMNGSPNIVTQGLRTLELCVDNLQPEYLLENMLPVRGALMQGLWRVVSKAPDTSSMTAAFRILGKFGGANRKLLNQPQILQVATLGDTVQSYINMEFSRMGLDGNHSIHLPLSELMRVVADQMRYPADMILNPSPAMIPSTHMKKWCMELSKAVLLAGLGSSGSPITPSANLPKIIKKLLEDFDPNNRTTEVYTCPRESDRELFVNALLAMAYGIWNKDGFRHVYSKFFIKVLRQFALIGVLEYIGGNGWMRHAEEEGVLPLCLDSSVMVDALIICLSETSSSFIIAGVMSLRHINETLSLTLPDIDQMSKVPMCKYLMEKVFKLCHGPAWYARSGGINAIGYMIESFPRKFVMDFVIDVVDSIMEVILGTVEEISSGSADSAYDCLKKMMRVYFIKEEGQEEENLTLATIFVSAISKHYFHSNERVREFAIGLMDHCMVHSRLAPSLDKFYYRFKEFFEPELMRVLTTVPTMSLADAGGSLDGVQNYMFNCPDGFDFEKDMDMYKRYLSHLLDIAQTDTFTLNQRNAFKKCETCPSHFLPPFPITTHIDSMRASALQCLVIAYDRMKKQYIDKGIELGDEHKMIEILALRSSKITVDQVYESDESWRRLMTVLLRAVTDRETPEIAEKLHPSLLKVSPISTIIIATFGASYIRNISGAGDDSDSDRHISYNDIMKFKCLVELNPKILVTKMAVNLANQMVKYKMSDKISRILSVPSSFTEEELDDFEAEKMKGIRELDMIGHTVKMLAGCPVTTFTEQIIVDISRFAAHFEYAYSQDVLVNWIDDVTVILNKSPKDVWKFFLSRESILDPARRSFIRRIIVYQSSGPLRQEFMDTPEYFEKLIDLDDEENKDEDERKIWDRDMFAFSIVDRISKSCPEWLISPNSPIPRIKKLFSETEFNERYVVRALTEVKKFQEEIIVKRMTEHKYKVPKLILNTFLRYLRLNIYDYDLFIVIASCFNGNFVTDLSFLREYLETEVIPKVPLQWRRELFLRIMQKFDTDPQTAGTSMQHVKALQYLVIPTLHWAFERYDTDEIVGTAPIDDSDSSMDVDPAGSSDNLVARLTSVIDSHRNYLSDGMVIVFYQLCTLFVQNASEHIHNNNCKKQGGRLRILMLFAWPCLTMYNHQDPTMRYTGFFFLANIIERFTINRKIVLQVFHQLMTTYQQDTRDQIRKAIDILTPALRTRMEDGHLQILSHVKKILIEECHNLQHVQHVFQMVVRNYRVYYHVRLELLTPLLNGVQRALVMPNSVLENWQTRRHAVEICEMVIKWELFRTLKTDHIISDEEALEVDKQLDKLRTASSTDRFDFEEAHNKRDMPDAQRTIIKEHADVIVNMLVRFCMTFHQNSGSSSTSQSGNHGVELTKKCQLLLRAALRPSMWGEFVSFRLTMIEKFLSIPNDNALRNDISSTAYANTIQNAQHTLDMLCNIIPVMPKTSLMTMMRQLQRPLIQCLNNGAQNFKMTRLVTQIVSRLLEKTNVSVNGLDELEQLNQYISRFLHEHFGSLLNCRNLSGPVLGVLGAFSLLRTICGHEPAYLDHLMPSFVKVMERAAKEHLAYVANSQDGNMVKNFFPDVAELLCACMELVRPRVDHISMEIKRSIVGGIIAELIIKSNHDKIIQTSVKLLGAMISTQDMEFTILTVLPLLVRIQSIIVTKFKNCKDLIADYLVVVITVFENSEYRNSEAGSRLWEGFFWGLKSSDPQTREKFSIVWEKTWPHMATVDIAHRMKYIMQNQDWSKFKHAFWLKFALWGMLRTIAKRPTDPNNKRKKVILLNCATPWRTIEYAAKLKDQPMEVETEMKREEPEPMEVDEKDSQDDSKDAGEPKEKEKLTLELLLAGQQELLDEASNYDFADALDTVSQITFALNENQVTSKMWVVLFKSFWSSLSQSEIEDFTALVVPFMSSGVHNNYQTGVQDSVLAVWLEAVGDAVHLPSRLIEFISSKHECWHTGIRLLENHIWTIPKQLNNTLLREMKVAPGLAGDIETLESLGTLYNEISEFDQFAAIWERRAVFPDTMRAMSAMQLGDMELAQSYLEKSMSSTYETLAPTINPNNTSNSEKHVSPIIDKEYDHWMEMYITNCSELLQWQNVADVCNGKDMQHVRGLINAASHIPDWNVVEECKSQIAGCIPPSFHLDYTLFNLMSTVMRMNENSSPTHMKERCKIAIQECTEAHISRWRALPSVVSYGHVKILQAMNLVREIEESTDIRIALLEAPSNKVDQALMGDMKSLMKVFRNRTPTTSDDMGFVSTWYDWRNQIHGMMLQRFEYWDKVGLNVAATGNQSIVPIHSMAQAQLAVAKHAKNLGFHNLTKDLLNKLAGLTAIPMMDAQDKVCTYGKTLRDMANSAADERVKNELLCEALEVLEDVRIDDLQKDQVAALLYHRANIHSVLDQAENADYTFSAASQLVDLQNSVTTTGIKLMKNWGHHLYKRFFSTTVCKETGNNFGRQALACYFIAARVDNDIKARKPIAKILWLSKHLNACGSHEVMNRVIKKQLHSLNLFNWLYWLPQLVTDVRYKPNSNFVLILCKMAAAHPLQVFYHIREAVSVDDIDSVLEEDYTDEQMSMDVSDEDCFADDPPFDRILKICLKYRPTDIRVFHRVLKELDEMNETWVERHLRHAICLKDQMFKDFSEQMDATFNEMQYSEDVTMMTLRWRKQLEEDLVYFQQNYNLDFLEIRNKRKMIVTKGCMGVEKSQIMFEKELSQVFTEPAGMQDEFDFVTNMTNMMVSQLDIHAVDAPRPQGYIRIVLDWIRAIRRRFDRLPRRIPLESSSPYLARFSHRTGCIEMPYDLLNVLRAKNHTLMASNQTGQYISMLSRFEPNFEIVIKGGQVIRKIYIRGQTGKSAAFYLKKSVQDEPTNRVPQMFKHLDHVLQTDRESARRHLHAPTVLQMRVGQKTTLYEVASVQPYAMPPDCTRNYPASQIDIVHPYDVLTATFNGSYYPDDMVLHFFERFAQSSSSIGQPLPTPTNQDGTVAPPRLTEAHHIKNIIYEDFARDMIPFRLLYDYLTARYPDPVMYYAMKKQLLHSLAVLSTIEYHCNLTPMGPDQMMMTMNTGVLSNPSYRFEIRGGRSLHDIQHFGHEVPFRLTPNLSILVGVAQDGDLLWSMAAASKCLMKKEPEVIMRPLVWDEFANNTDCDKSVFACHASNSYINGVASKLRNTNSADAKLRKDDCVSLISRAKDSDNLARMPPTYHAWF
ncbi:Transcription-associated protein 1 [Caenorhabditis elegans]|uniref:Isoform b of Transcription-associated protein 1 n=1 Tax=Caenorhabditis elegans TaxID=6239 RepID=G5EEV2-2|nr:Transcription-associated protein 1 [Caenorhabditis elegans]CAH10779.2 Transcription-associated protein 1 [Caenorhabditis elegans]